MRIKIAVLFLGALLLVQGTWSAPTGSAEKMIDDLVDIFKQIAERFEIIEVSVDELLNLDEAVQGEGKTLLNKVLDDPKVQELKGEKADKLRKKIRDYADTLKDDDETKQTHAIEYLNFEDLVDEFRKEKVENIGKESEVIGNSFKENGLENFEKTVLDHFGKFVKKFVEQIDAHVKNLNDEDKKDEKEVIDWYNKFVAEEDLYKKLVIFDEFFVAQVENKNDINEKD